MELSKNAFDYSVRIAELVKFLRKADNEFPLCRELLDCGISVGLCFHTISKELDPELPDYQKAAKAVITSDYLIEMAVRSGYLTEVQSKYIREDGRHLLYQLHGEETS